MISYRTTGAWGVGKGGALLPVEIDKNFAAINAKIDTAEDTFLAADIENISVVGSQIRILLKDGTTLGPYQIPKADLNWRGDFADATEYLTNDFLGVDQGIYLVLQDHTSVAPFDPDREISGSPVYSPIFSGSREIPQSTVGVLTVSSGYPIITVAQKSSYYRFINSLTLEIPHNSSQPFPIGTLLAFRRDSGTAVSFSAVSGVTLNVPAGFQAQAAGVGTVCYLAKIAENEWDLFGELEPV